LSFVIWSFRASSIRGGAEYRFAPAWLDAWDEQLRMLRDI
jgi:hypothetical protein